MQKVLIILGAWFTTLAATTCFAQDASNDSIRRQIREMKLSEEYVYAEANSTTSPSEAKQSASEKLYTNAVGLMSEHNKKKEEIESTWKTAEKETRLLEYQNGTLYKVFVCIPKGLLIEMPKKAAAATEEPAVAETAPVPAETPVAETLVAEKPVASEPAAEMPVIPEEPESADAYVVLQDTATVQSPSETEIAEATSSNDSIMHAVARQLGTTSTPPRDPNVPGEKAFNLDDRTAALALEMLNMAEAGPQPQPDSLSDTKIETEQAQPAAPQPITDPLENVSEITRRVLGDLLAMETYESAMIYLSAMKEDGRLMFGSLRKAIMLERSYLLIVKDGKVETILNKGAGERINLRTNQSESIKKYIGYGIIWLQVFN